MARPPQVEEQDAAGPVVLNTENVGLSQEQFFQLCSGNCDLRLELTARKELVVMPLPGPDTSWRNVIITTELTNWVRKDGAGDHLRLRVPVHLT